MIKLISLYAQKLLNLLSQYNKVLNIMEISTYLTEIAPQLADHSKKRSNSTKLDHNEGSCLKIMRSVSKKIRRAPKKFSKKAINTFLSDQYYKDKRVKPGIGIYLAILQADQRRITQPNIPYLSINIPQTVLSYKNQTKLIYSSLGIVKLKSLNNCNEQDTYLTHQLIDCGYPLLLSGIGQGSKINFNIISSFEIQNLKLLKNQKQISFKFIKPYGDYPNILRLFYTSKNTKKSKPNFAYKGINHNKISYEIVDNKKKQNCNYIVDFDKDDFISINQVMGKALTEVQHMAQSIIDFLEIVKNVKITQIVIDFIFSHDRLYYFHQLKSIKSTTLYNIWGIGIHQQIHEKYKDPVEQAVCKLCGCLFPRSSISKLVTNKLIYEFLVHLKKRGQNQFKTSHMNKKTINMSVSHYVCELCYELIIAEHELINIQRQFNALLNVQTDPIVRVRDINCFNRQRKRQLTLTKWRIFFYIQGVKNFIIDDTTTQNNFITITLKFNDVKSSLLKKYQISNGQRLSQKTMKKISDKKICINSFNNKMKCEKIRKVQRVGNAYLVQNKLSYEKIKLITFYTKKQSIQQLFHNQILQLQLVNEGHKYKGNTLILHNFKNNKLCQRYSSQIILFNNKYQYCNLQLNIGLINDGSTNVSLQQITESHDNKFYFTEQNQGCQPLPQQWIQIVTQKNNVKKLSQLQKKNIINLNDQKLISNILAIDNLKTKIHQSTKTQTQQTEAYDF